MGRLGACCGTVCELPGGAGSGVLLQESLTPVCQLALFILLLRRMFCHPTSCDMLFAPRTGEACFH
jgi:hypothetical protein